MLITGVDIIEIKRIKKVSASYGERFYNRIFTVNELVYCRGRAPQLASRFAAKEAVMKALGTGTRGVSWKDIEVKRKRGMAPFIELHRRARERATQIGLKDLTLSLSHSKEFAIAAVVGNSEKTNQTPRQL